MFELLFWSAKSVLKLCGILLTALRSLFGCVIYSQAVKQNKKYLDNEIFMIIEALINKEKGLWFYIVKCNITIKIDLGRFLFFIIPLLKTCSDDIYVLFKRYMGRGSYNILSR